MSVTSFGVDVGTTAVKCVVTRVDSDTHDYELLGSSYVALTDVPHHAQPSVHGEQHVEQVLRAVHRAIIAIPQQQRDHVTSIGICGQMHGIVWWRSADVCDHVVRLLASHDTEWLQPHESRAWSTLVTWQDQRCSPAFVRECTKRVERALAATASAAHSSASPLATGYGLATYAHTLAHAPALLADFDACGTIQDLVAFALCGHNSRAAASIDITNAFSWGGLDLQRATWNCDAVTALGLPLEMLPTVKQSGDVVGHVASGSPFELPSSARVFVPIGDHPSSVVAALAQQQQQQSTGQLSATASLTLVNVGTSAQLAMLLSADEAAAAPSTKSFEIRPFALPNQLLGVAASLSGGNVFAWFVAQCRDWMRELGVSSMDSDEDLAHWYARVIDLGMAKRDTTLAFCPTLSGERADPSARGSIEQLNLANGSLGDLSAALCKGLIDNLFAMVPPPLRIAASTRTVIATGSALERNALLRHFLSAKLVDASRQLQIQSTADAALGAALTPVLLQYPQEQ